MMRVIRVLAYGAGLLVLLALPAAADELKAGDQAPDFTLKASDGQTYSLSALRGKNVVLAWFPKAFTAG
jgi:peroxiredoxin Q/BCP